MLRLSSLILILISVRTCSSQMTIPELYQTWNNVSNPLCFTMPSSDLSQQSVVQPPSLYCKSGIIVLYSQRTPETSTTGLLSLEVDNPDYDSCDAFIRTLVARLNFALRAQCPGLKSCTPHLSGDDSGIFADMASRCPMAQSVNNFLSSVCINIFYICLKPNPSSTDDSMLSTYKLVNTTLSQCRTPSNPFAPPIVVTGKRGWILSPGYPYGYPSNMTCVWNLTLGAQYHLISTIFDISLYHALPPLNQTYPPSPSLTGPTTTAGPIDLDPNATIAWYNVPDICVNAVDYLTLNTSVDGDYTEACGSLPNIGHDALDTHRTFAVLKFITGSVSKRTFDTGNVARGFAVYFEQELACVGVLPFDKAHPNATFSWYTSNSIIITCPQGTYVNGTGDVYQFIECTTKGWENPLSCFDSAAGNNSLDEGLPTFAIILLSVLGVAFFLFLVASIVILELLLKRKYHTYFPCVPSWRKRAQPKAPQIKKFESKLENNKAGYLSPGKPDENLYHSPSQNYSGGSTYGGGVYGGNGSSAYGGGGIYGGSDGKSTTYSVYSAGATSPLPSFSGNALNSSRTDMNATTGPGGSSLHYNPSGASQYYEPQHIATNEDAQAANPYEAARVSSPKHIVNGGGQQVSGGGKPNEEEEEEEFEQPTSRAPPLPTHVATSGFGLPAPPPVPAPPPLPSPGVRNAPSLPAALPPFEEESSILSLPSPPVPPPKQPIPSWATPPSSNITPPKPSRYSANGQQGDNDYIEMSPFPAPPPPPPK